MRAIIQNKCWAETGEEESSEIRFSNNRTSLSSRYSLHLFTSYIRFKLICSILERTETRKQIFGIWIRYNLKNIKFIQILIYMPIFFVFYWNLQEKAIMDFMTLAVHIEVLKSIRAMRRVNVTSISMSWVASHRHVSMIRFLFVRNWKPLKLPSPFGSVMINHNLYQCLIYIE